MKDIDFKAFYLLVLTAAIAFTLSIPKKAYANADDDQYLGAWAKAVTQYNESVHKAHDRGEKLTLSQKKALHDKAFADVPAAYHKYIDKITKRTIQLTHLRPGDLKGGTHELSESHDTDENNGRNHRDDSKLQTSSTSIDQDTTGGGKVESGSAENVTFSKPSNNRKPATVDVNRSTKSESGGAQSVTFSSGDASGK